MSFKVYNNSVWSNQKSLKVFYNSVWKPAVKGWVFQNSQWKLAYPEYPASTANPTITATSGQIGRIGATYTVSNGSWNSLDAYLPTTYSYQWKRSGSDISGQTGQTYTTVNADSDSVISCTVTATNARGSTSINVSTGVIELPNLTNATVYDYTYTPGAPGSVSISTSQGAYSGSFTAGSNATSYDGTTTNGTISVYPGSQTYSGTGTGGAVQVGIRSINTSHQVALIWNHVAGAASYDIWVGTFGGAQGAWKNVSAAGKNPGDQFFEIYTGANTSSTYYTIAPKSPSGTQGYAYQTIVSTSDKYSNYTYASGTIPSLTAFTYNVSNATATPTQPSFNTPSFNGSSISYSWTSSNATSWYSSISGGPEGARSNARSVSNDFWSGTAGYTYTLSVYGINSNKYALVSWGSSTGATSYTVYYTLDGYTTNQSTTGTSLLLAGSNLSVSAVVASDGSSSLYGNAGSSNISISDATGSTGTYYYTTPVPAPGTPGAPTVIGTSTSSVSVSWSSVANASTYDLFWNYTSSGPGATPDYTGIAGTSKTITGLASGSNIYVWIRAVGSGGTSGWSSYGVGATNSSGTAPGNPSLSNSYSYSSPYNNWTLTITPNGGTAPVTYYWSIMFSNSSGGSTLASATGSTTGTSVTRNSSTYNWARWSVYASNAYGTSGTVYSNWA